MNYRDTICRAFTFYHDFLNHGYGVRNHLSRGYPMIEGLLQYQNSITLRIGFHHQFRGSMAYETLRSNIVDLCGNEANFVVKALSEICLTPVVFGAADNYDSYGSSFSCDRGKVMLRSTMGCVWSHQHNFTDISLADRKRIAEIRVELHQIAEINEKNCSTAEMRYFYVSSGKLHEMVQKARSLVAEKQTLIVKTKDTVQSLGVPEPFEYLMTPRKELLAFQTERELLKQQIESGARSQVDMLEFKTRYKKWKEKILPSIFFIDSEDCLCKIFDNRL